MSVSTVITCNGCGRKLEIEADTEVILDDIDLNWMTVQPRFALEKQQVTADFCSWGCLGEYARRRTAKAVDAVEV